MEAIHPHRDIVEKCKTGNRAAQFELYQHYSKAMYNICLRMLRHEADSEDVLQQAFTDIFMKIDTFSYQASIGSWIKRIVINNCINFLKSSRAKWEEFDQNKMDRSDGDELENSTLLTVEMVKNALFQLPDGYRVVFSLYAFEGYDHEEIAQILGISESTSKSQYSRAKQKLRTLCVLK